MFGGSSVYGLSSDTTQSVAAGVEDGLLESDTAVQQGWLKNSESLNNLHFVLGHLSVSKQDDLR